MNTYIKNITLEKTLRLCLFLVIVLFLLNGVLFPIIELVIKSLHNQETITTETGIAKKEIFTGIKNFTDYFSNRQLSASLLNSLKVSFLSSIISLLLTFLAAYGLQRTKMGGKSLFKVIFMLPMFAPTMFYGLVLVYLFGRQGLITTGFFGFMPGYDINLYGIRGIVISEILYVFPPMLIIMMVAFNNIDRRLYEAAQALDTSALKIFTTITIPGVRYGMISAFFAGFTLVFTDFGAPKVVGGSFNVLAVDIYKRVVGQQDFYIGATISIILLVPAVISFFADRIIQKRQNASLTAKSEPYVPKIIPLKDRLFFLISFVISAVIAVIILTGLYASLIKLWPYNLTLGLQNYTFKGMAANRGLLPYYNSIKMSLSSAVIGTVLSFFSAYLVTKLRGLEFFKKTVSVLSLIPLALPGLVIGFSYIFFYNRPELFGMPNPLNSIYGTMAILVLSTIIHFFTVSFLTAKTALQQLDNEFDMVSESMGIPFWKTFSRVTVPICLPTVIEIFMYIFAGAMATVSAVIFLYSSKTIPATVSIMNMDDAGDQAPALAMCILIIATNILMKIICEILLNYLKKRKLKIIKK